MKYRFCIGEGEPPLYVRHLENYRKWGLTISGPNNLFNKKIAETSYAGSLKDKNQNEMIFSFLSEQELKNFCIWLVRNKVCFSVGGWNAWGPAEVMEEWLQDRSISVQFLKISWTGKDNWQIHEIGPKTTKEWDQVSLKEIFL
ncbi:MAG: hypothetical protein A4E62_02604 [Syntrophorhabdus sp. PtaU1.Bin002]|nr:MAG: hypothetical protein A4E62_02604 [Syntrophorhabdus sp. PtaU1.Bin002]